MREFSFNIPANGLKPNATGRGATSLSNLKCEDGFYSVPDALTMQWASGCRLFKGQSTTWLAGKIVEDDDNEIPDGAIPIADEATLRLIGRDPSYPITAYYYLTDNIALTSEWVPVNAPFTGTLNGQGYTISNIIISDDNGFFPSVSGTVFNLTLSGTVSHASNTTGMLCGSIAGTVTSVTCIGTVSGTDFVGGLAGISTGTVTKCIFSGTVTGSGDRVGGLVGNLLTGSVTRFYTEGTVMGSGYVGGAVGWASPDTSVNYVYSTADVTSDNHAGGVVGYIGTDASLWYSYATGTVTGRTVGGLVGTASDPDSITRCYATGAVVPVGTNTSAGGLIGILLGSPVTLCYSAGAVGVATQRGGMVGRLDAGSTVATSYYDQTTSGCSDNDGRGVPKTTADMQKQATYENWDFVATWLIYEDSSYPFLQVITESDVGSIYSVNETDLSITQVVNYIGDAKFQIADFGPVWIATNGTHTVAMYGGSAGQVTRLGSVCSRQGRLIWGDVDGSQNYVGWTTTGGETLPFVLAGTAVSGWLLDLDEHGGAPMPWRGAVQAIKNLGDHIIVYGEDGVTALVKQGNGFAPMPITGIPRGLGIYDRDAVDGDDTKHIFRGSDGALWLITPDLKAQKLDYAWILTDEDSVVRNPLTDEFWISNGTTAYLLTQFGLSGPNEQAPTSMIVVDGDILGTGTANPSTLRFGVTTDMFDVNQNAQKRVTMVNLCGTFGSARIGMNTRFDTNSAWRMRPYVRCSPEGAGILNTNCVYGQILIDAACDPGDRLTRIETRYQAHDRRFVRGTRSVTDSNDT